MTLVPGETATVSFHNKRNTGSVQLIKTTNTGKNLNGWKIGLYTDAACTQPIAGSPFTTGADGTVLVPDLAPGTLYAKEVQVEDAYWVCDSTVKLVQIIPNQTASVAFTNTHYKYNKPRYANLRGLDTDFVGDATGSDKRFSFSIPAPGSNTVHLFESAIDLLSYATLVKLSVGNWQREHLVSLAGVYKPKENLQESSMPLALKRYLSEHSEIRNITLRLDNDATGGRAAKALVSMLSNQYEVSVQPPPYGKDYNDYLCMRLGLPITHRKGKSQER